MGQSPDEIYNPERRTRTRAAWVGTASRELLNISVQDLNAQQFGHEGDSSHYGALSFDVIEEPPVKPVDAKPEEESAEEPDLASKGNRYQILKRPKTSKYRSIRNSADQTSMRSYTSSSIDNGRGSTHSWYGR